MGEDEGRQALLALGRELVDWACRNDPPLATDLGVHTYDDRFADLSLDGLANRAAEARAYLDRLNGTDPGVLDAESRVEWKLIWSWLKDSIRETSELRLWERNPCLWVESVLLGCYFLVSRDFAPLEQRAANLASRMEAVPAFLGQARVTLRAPVRPAVELAVDEAGAGRGFFAHLAAATSPQVPHLKARLQGAAEKAERALADFAEFLRRDLLPCSRPEFAIGREAVDRILRERFFLNLGIAEVVRIGSEAFDRIRGELEELAGQIAPGKGWMKILEEMKLEQPPEDGVLEAYRREVEQSRAFVEESRVIPLPGDEQLVVERTPVFERSLVPFAAYLTLPPLDPRPQPGIFWVTCPEPGDPPNRVAELLANHNRFSCRLTALHEGYPGHHLQSVHASRAGTRFRRLFSCSLFQEGWALYCEELMHRLGYLSEPRMKVQMLRDQLWRSARVIIDGRLQLGQMSIEEGARLLAEGVGMGPAEALAEVKRYALEPTQPLSYFIGRLEILRLRDRFGHKAGRLDLFEFHRQLLSRGSIPMALIEEELFA
ncbi:MAG: DUF885 domain-containing protein [Acetobacteraceae bacterium]|nr:DUF885 domain-containing protein [Acetobacteraceae bacterium]